MMYDFIKNIKLKDELKYKDFIFGILLISLLFMFMGVRKFRLISLEKEFYLKNNLLVCNKILFVNQIKDNQIVLSDKSIIKKDLQISYNFQQNDKFCQNFNFFYIK